MLRPKTGRWSGFIVHPSCGGVVCWLGVAEAYTLVDAVVLDDPGFPFSIAMVDNVLGVTHYI